MAPRAKDDGRLRLHTKFKSCYLSTPRTIAVSLPRDYDASTRRYPVFYLHDGQNLFDPNTAFAGADWAADVAAESLAARNVIPPLILVGVYNTGVRRVSEYTPTRAPKLQKGGKASRHAFMLAHEIKPFIDQTYRTLRRPVDTAVGGSSLGALAALVAGIEQPHAFGSMALLSPSVWWDRRAILENVEDWKPKRPPRIWLDTGTREGKDPAATIADTRLLRDALQPKSADLRYLEAESRTHDERSWSDRFPQVLEFLFAR